MQTKNPRPGLIRPGAPTTVSEILAWELGYNCAIERVGDALEDARYAIYPLPRMSKQERIAIEIAAMEKCAISVRKQITAEAAGTIPRGRPWGSS